ncbi:MAG TPA: bifunctional UDP-N-acetylglucosamine diphosphorylase/glucosamine-1-phosphate N-acetyltransferase GlmU [Syntrophorhabdaceae bacterium]|nr:bifunctional UDP-N-acetylglucosamine diphosphorylase/glucosamine-1-phosphate N-acetyltransferase GlmU [Syntrophorhabdaceae bacterium]
MKALDVVILAAGKGERMVSSKPKVMHEIMGRSMIDYVVDTASKLEPATIIVVTGYGREEVEAHLAGKPVVCAVQKEQRGTAHALLSSEEFLTGNDVLVLYGDVPLMEPSTLKEFVSFYEKDKQITFMTTLVSDPSGYGRIISDGDRILHIREEIDASPEERKIKEINTGICLIPGKCMAYVREIGADNKKGEHYLTDICGVAASKGEVVRAYRHLSASEVLGTNSRKELLEANMTVRMRILERHLKNGVSFADSNVYIEDDVQIGRDVMIFPNCYITGKTAIGNRVTVGPNVIIRDSIIHDDVEIEGFVVMEGVELKAGAKAGPFSRLRPKSVVEKGAKIGNFVEVKNSVIGEGSKASHLTYIGDSTIGKKVNIGAGTITCNYDGVKKHKTVIEDEVFVGSNTELVAPVTIGKGAVIGAGTTVTKNVPEGALAITRVQQKHIAGYGRKKKCAE